MAIYHQTYTSMMVKQRNEIHKAEMNNIDAFVNIVNSVKHEPATVKMPVSIGLKPETIEKAESAEKKKETDDFFEGFMSGAAFILCAERREFEWLISQLIAHGMKICLPKKNACVSWKMRSEA